MEDVVLGAGISGAVAGFYFNATVIGRREESQEEQGFSLGPRLLQKVEGTTQLLKDLNIEPSLKTARVGYYYDNETHPDCPDNLRKQYFLKTRKHGSLYNSVMSEGKTHIDYYDVDREKLTNKLFENITQIELLSDKIDLEKKRVYIGDGDWLGYDRLISTIPMPIFLKIAGIKLDHDFTAIDKIFALAIIKGLDKSYDYVYYPEEDNLWTRVTRISGSLYTVEGSGFDLCGQDGEILKIQTLPKAQLLYNLETLPVLKDVMFAGRYGCWNHNMKIQNTINDCKKWIN